MSEGKLLAGTMSRAVVFHAVCMTLILFIAFPFLLYHFVKQKTANKFRFKVCQMICTIVVIAVGSYASYVFSEHNSIHAVLGLIIMCVIMPLWTLFQNVDSLKSMGLPQARLQSVRKWLTLSLLVFLFPTQWMLGIQYTTYETGIYSKTEATSYFLAHYFPGYCFMILGVMTIWRSANMDRVMKTEMYMLAPAAVIAMAGQLYNDLKVNSPRFWSHVIIECVAMFLGVLCFVIYKLNIAKRALLHGLCLTMFWGLFGGLMLSHQTGGDLRGMMYEIVGGVTIATAVVRIVCIFWDKLPMVYGFLTLAAGMIFNFSNPCLSEYWENVLGYPIMSYIVLVIMFGFYLSSISGIFQQLLVGGGLKPESTMPAKEQPKDLWDDESTPLVQGQRMMVQVEDGVPNRGVIDISKLPTIAE